MLAAATPHVDVTDHVADIVDRVRIAVGATGQRAEVDGVVLVCGVGHVRGVEVGEVVGFHVLVLLGHHAGDRLLQDGELVAG